MSNFDSELFSVTTSSRGIVSSPLHNVCLGTSPEAQSCNRCSTCLKTSPWTRSTQNFWFPTVDLLFLAPRIRSLVDICQFYIVLYTGSCFISYQNFDGLICTNFTFFMRTWNEIWSTRLMCTILLTEQICSRKIPIGNRKIQSDVGSFRFVLFAFLSVI